MTQAQNLLNQIRLTCTPRVVIPVNPQPGDRDPRLGWEHGAPHPRLTGQIERFRLELIALLKAEKQADYEAMPVEECNISPDDPIQRNAPSLKKMGGTKNMNRV